MGLRVDLSKSESLWLGLGIGKRLRMYKVEGQGLGLGKGWGPVVQFQDCSSFTDPIKQHKLRLWRISAERDQDCGHNGLAVQRGETPKELAVFLHQVAP